MQQEEDLMEKSGRELDVQVCRYRAKKTKQSTDKYIKSRISKTNKKTTKEIHILIIFINIAATTVTFFSECFLCFPC